MQQQLLAAHPDAALRVYVVWLAMLPQDGRSRWSAGLMPDRRVTHLWDGERAVSRWFAERVEHRDDEQHRQSDAGGPGTNQAVE